MGDDWEADLAEGLRTSRVCLSLCSPSYLNSTYCGKEYQVFLDRLALFSTEVGRKPPLAIIPILWVRPPGGSFPNLISRFQNTQDGFPEVYAQEGLRYMMRLSKHKDDYEQLVYRLGTKLIEASERGLPDLRELRPLREVGSAFHSLLKASGLTVVAKAERGGGPNNARFVFVAATRAEMQHLRKVSERYGEEGGWYWRPYHPEDDCVGSLAESVAGKLKLRYHELPLADDLVDRLKEAERNREVVVLLADAWSVRLERYQRFMLRYDQELLANCAIIVPWNEEDEQITSEREQLDQALRSAFPRKTILRLPHHHWCSRSLKDLRAKLTRALTEARMMVLEVAEVARRAESTGLVKEAEQQGISADLKPCLVGPGEGSD